MIGGQQKQIMKETGDHGSGWQLANITGGLSSLTNFSIIIEVVHTTGSFQGDIAIDDIKFVDCTPGAENSPASCDFESGLCSLQHVTANVDFNWERNKGGTGSWDTGPTADHTTNSADGYYIFTEASYPRREVLSFMLLFNISILIMLVVGSCIVLIGLQLATLSPILQLKI